AHAMAPNLGQGAAQGIEDAATLTLLLRSVRSGRQLGQTLANYHRLRSIRTTATWRQSRYVGAMAQADGAITTSRRDVVMRLAPGWLAGAASARIQQWSRPD